MQNPKNVDRIYRRPESVLVVVYAPPDQTLLLKRNAAGIFWQSVTGSMEWDETHPLQTAVRELAEETGIVAKQDQFKDWNRRFRYSIPKSLRYRYRAGVHFNVEHVFSIQVPEMVSIKLMQKEHNQYKWIKFTDALDLVWSWSNREAINILADQCKKAKFVH